MRNLILLVLCATIYGCATGPGFHGLREIEEGKGVLYLMWPSSVAALGGLEIKVDGVKQKKIRALGYRRIPLAQGVHRIKLAAKGRAEEISFEINVVAGDRYYYAYEYKMDKVKVLGIPITKEPFSDRAQTSTLSEKDALRILGNLNES